MRISDWSSDVCSSDLFWLGIDLGALGQHQVGDALIRVGLLRARLHDHATIEHGLARPETDATEILVAGAMGGGVIDLVLVVEMHTRVGGEQSGEFGLCAWRCELHAPVVTDQLDRKSTSMNPSH